MQTQWSVEELDRLFPSKTHLTCPICGTTKFQMGPRGGEARNARCENLHEWTCSAFGMEFNEPRGHTSPGRGARLRNWRGWPKELRRALGFQRCKAK